MTVNNFETVPYPKFPIANVTPFTYRDGHTYLELVEAMRKHINDSVVPTLQENVDAFIQALDDMHAAFLADLGDYRDQVIASQTEYTNLFNQYMDQFVTSVGHVDDVYDQVVALRDEVGVISGLTGEDEAVALLINSSSDTRTALDSAIVQETIASVRTYPSMAALMATDAPTNSRVAIAGFASWDDVTSIMFTIHDTLPVDRVLRRSSVPLDDGRYAAPRDYQMMSQVAWDSRGAAELIACAETYVAAGADLVYDSTRPWPLGTSDIVHETQTAPYAITCSSLAGLVVGGFNYEDTTYVADRNTQSWRWGTRYPVAQFTGHPFGSYRFLKYFWQAGLAYYYSPDKTNLMPGDLLFYCKQDPEGPGTGGHYFLNNYHVAVYKGAGQVIHAYAPSSGNGVKQQAMSETPVDDICWIVRPAVKHVPLNKTPGPVATTADFTGDVWTWIDDDLLQVDLNGISATDSLNAGSTTILGNVGYKLTRTVRNTALAVSGTTSTPVRILLTAAGEMQVYSPVAIPAGTVFHGGLTGHVIA